MYRRPAWLAPFVRAMSAATVYTPHAVGCRAARRKVARRSCAWTRPPTCATPAESLALLLASPPDLHSAGPAVADAVEVVVRDARPVSSIADVLAASDGRWEVIYAPHIQRLTAPFAMTTKPLRYEFSGGGSRIRSDVRYASPLVGKGWFCAEGRLQARPGEQAVDVLFDSFWLATGEAPGPNPLTSGAPVSWTDALVQAIGTAFFFPQLSRFPVVLVDPDVRLAVFEFPPLSTTIVAKRV